MPQDSVRCTREINSELLSFGFLESHSAIIHLIVRCGSGLSGVPSVATVASATVDSNSRLTTHSAWTVRAESDQPTEGAPDSEQYLFGAAPDCPVQHEDKAPTVETVRTLTVG